MRALTLFCLFCVLGGGAVFVISKNSSESSHKSEEKTFVETSIPTSVATPAPAITASFKPSPTPRVRDVDLPMWFTSQAPTGNWDVLHEDACEEASLLMVQQFRKGEALSVADSDAEIKHLVSVGESLGQKPSITLEELRQLAKTAYGLSGRIEPVVSKENIITELTAGRPVIVPAAGRELGNPNFTAPGPLYHMLVIRGYEKASDTFITNDPGTRKGEGYRYGSKTLLSAVHDYNEADIDLGKPAYLVFD